MLKAGKVKEIWRGKGVVLDQKILGRPKSSQSVMSWDPDKQSEPEVILGTSGLSKATAWN